MSCATRSVCASIYIYIYTYCAQVHVYTNTFRSLYTLMKVCLCGAEQRGPAGCEETAKHQMKEHQLNTYKHIQCTQTIHVQVVPARG